MLRKIFFAILLATTILLTACGGENSSSTTPTPEFTADKAILAYAQLFACAAPDDPKAAGFTDKFVDDSRQMMFAAFKNWPLGEQTSRKVADNFAATLKSRMNFKTTLKTDDKAHPTVELTCKPADFSAAFKDMSKDADLLTLRKDWGELQSRGLNDNSIAKDADFQKLAVDLIGKYLAKIPLKPEASLVVTCKVAVGEDGKFYWAPEDAEAISKFVTGQP